MEADPSLARAHEAGASVIHIQHAEHAHLGSIAYEVRTLWLLHIGMAMQGYGLLRYLHEQVVRVPVDAANTRTLTAKDNPDLAARVYGTGTQMVINTVLTMQHFCAEVERALGMSEQPRKGDLGDRMRRSFGMAGLPMDAEGYSALQAMIELRDAIEHPRQENTRNSHPNNWDRVPMGWFLSERAPRAFERWEGWFRAAQEQ
jgi:hypothetical protein